MSFYPHGLCYSQKYSSAPPPSRWSRRWRSRMWKSWVGVVTRGLRLRGRLDILPNSLKWSWRQLMVEKWTLHSLATAQVDSPAVSHAPSNLETSVALCCVPELAFYCSQHNVDLCNDCSVSSASRYGTPVRWMDCLCNGEMLTRGM